MSKKPEAPFDYWDAIIQIIKVEEPAPTRTIIEAVKRCEEGLTARKVDAELCAMARAGAIRRIWIEAARLEDWEERFTL